MKHIASYKALKYGFIALFYGVSHSTYAFSQVVSGFSYNPINPYIINNFNENFITHINENRPVEFVLGADGVVRPQGTEIVVNTKKDVKIKLKKDSNNEHYFDESRLGSFDILPKKRPQVPISKLKTTKKSGAPLCGKSPATIDEIKQMVSLEAKRQNVDVNFALAITRAESAYDRVRNSHKDARGPMQLIPATAERFGVKDVCDPEQNIAGGVKYLKFLLNEFDNPIYAAAAYNAGEGRIYQYKGVPPFKETLNYVAKVIGFAQGKSGLVSRSKKSPAKISSKSQNSNDSAVAAKPSVVNLSIKKTAKLTVPSKNKEELTQQKDKRAPTRNGSVLQF